MKTRTLSALLLFLGLLQSAFPDGINDGLLLHYSFDKNENGVVTDLSGNGRTARVHGARWVQDGLGGGAYKFTAEDDTITASDEGMPIGDAPRTFSIWVSLDRLRPAHIHASHIMHYGAIEYGQLFSLAVDWRVGRDCPTLSPWGYVAISNGRIERAGEWQHIVCSYSGGGQYQFYLNGVPTRGRPESRASLNTQPGGRFSIGELQTGYHALDGKVDEVRVYDRALNEDEVAALYQQGATLMEATALVRRSGNKSTPATESNTSAETPRTGALTTSSTDADREAGRTRGTGDETLAQNTAYQVTRIGFSTEENGDQDVTIFYLDETLHVQVQDVDLSPDDPNTLIRVSVYQKTLYEGGANITQDMQPNTNGYFTAAIPLHDLHAGQALVDIAGYNLGGQVLRLFRTSPIELRNPPLRPR